MKGPRIFKTAPILDGKAWDRLRASLRKSSENIAASMAKQFGSKVAGFDIDEAVDEFEALARNAERYEFIRNPDNFEGLPSKTWDALRTAEPTEFDSLIDRCMAIQARRSKQ